MILFVVEYTIWKIQPIMPTMSWSTFVQGSKMWQNNITICIKEQSDEAIKHEQKRDGEVTSAHNTNPSKFSRLYPWKQLSLSTLPRSERGAKKQSDVAFKLGVDLYPEMEAPMENEPSNLAGKKRQLQPPPLPPPPPPPLPPRNVMSFPFGCCCCCCCFRLRRARHFSCIVWRDSQYVLFLCSVYP